eukprot:693307-Prymnesium_polylepis.1
MSLTPRNPLVTGQQLGADFWGSRRSWSSTLLTAAEPQDATPGLCARDAVTESARLFWGSTRISSSQGMRTPVG